MRCKCGGIMQSKRLSIDTEIHVCILCGRDDLERRAGTSDDEEPTPTKPNWKRRRTCPSCHRTGLIFSGKCQRCITRIKRGLDVITGLPAQGVSQ